MVTAQRGEHGQRHETAITVPHPEPGGEKGWRVDDDVVMKCTVEDGQPLTLRLSHEDALKLIADLSRRLVMRFQPPPPLAVALEPETLV